MIKKIIYIVLLCFLCLSFTASETPTQKLISGSEKSSGFELVRDWRVLSFGALIISILFIAFAYMFGIAFDVRDLKAWGSVELNQLVVTGIILICLISVISFLDGILMTIVNYAQLSDASTGEKLQCQVTDSTLCSIRTADAYISGISKMIEDNAATAVDYSVNAAMYSNARVSAYCTQLISPIPCLWLSASMGIPGEAQKIMDVDRASTILEWYQNILSSLYAQQFFVKEVSYKIGPILLLLGIVARSFFLTRKTGGLLIASAVGIMFVFPAMYAFDWFTLNVTLFGDKAFPDTSTSCPSECLAHVPIAYDISHKKALNNFTDIKNILGSENAKKINDGTVKSVTVGSTTVESCTWYDTHTNVKNSSGGQVNCYSTCRELPYPFSSFLCAQYLVQEACSTVPSYCKITRYVSNPAENLNAICPNECKTIPALKSDCASPTIPNPGKTNSFFTCLNTSSNCRVALAANISFNYLLNYTTDCNSSQTCARSNISTQTCVDVLPYWEPQKCEDLCQDCPQECRIVNITKFGESYPSTSMGAVPGGITSSAIDCNSAACQKCPGSCKLDAVMLNNLSGSDCANAPSVRKAETGYSCALTPYACRFNMDFYTLNDPNADVCANSTNSIFAQQADGCKEQGCGISPTQPITGSCQAYDSTSADPANCKLCPLSCRIMLPGGTWVPQENCADLLPKGFADSNYNCSLKACPATCRVSYSPTSSCANYTYQSCDLCPVHCRVQLSTGNLPEGCPAEACSFVTCSSTCKRSVPLSECQSCIESPVSYTYTPPIQKDCAQLCSGTPKGVGVNPAEFARKSMEGMAGPQDLQNVSSVLIPAYLLPLLNILVTVMFVRTFSEILGGDVEIPGLPRVL